MEDALAPIARFLFLFALFTAIGTSLLTMRRSAEPADEAAEPPTTAAQQSLEPQRLAPHTDVIEPPAAPPTAAGPLGTKAPRTGLRIKEGNRSAIQNPQSAVGSRWSEPPIADADANRLPQLQISDVHKIGVGAGTRHTVLPGAGSPTRGIDSFGPPAMARLSGTILSAPTQQAHHDDNESSLH